MTLTRLWPVLKHTYSRWNEHEAPRLGAALAFYSMLSLAPLLVLVIAIAALAFGHDAAQHQIMYEMQDLVGSDGAKGIQSLIENAQKPASGIAASLLGIVTLLFGASGVFGELRSSLNKIWEAKRTASSGIVGMLRERFFSFGMVLAIGFLLLISLVVTAALAAVEKFFGGYLPIPGPVLHGLNFLISFAVIAFLFALIFKFVPDVKIAWNDVWVGAVATALLFTIGKFLIGLYLGKASVGSAYGAAGSLIVVIVWIYYSAQIFLFGAQFTEIYAHEQGSLTSPQQPR